MAVKEKFLNNVRSKDGFFSLERNTKLYKENNDALTPWVFAILIFAAIGLPMFSAVCMVVLVCKLFWRTFFKHVCRFVFTFWYTECDGHGKVIYEKPFPPCLRVDQNDPYK